MAEITFQLSATNVSGEVVTLPTQYVAVRSVIQHLSGDWTSTANVPPTTYTVVASAPTAGQVQLTAPNQLTFATGTTLNTTFGLLTVDGTPVGGQPRVGP